MMFKRLLTKTSLIGSVLGAVLTAGILIGCSGDTAPGDGRDSDGATASQATSESDGGGSGEHGRGACDAPRLNARRFERVVVDQLRANVLTESNIRDLVRLVGEEMDGVAHERRKQLETIESELADVRRRLDRLYHLMETTELDISDVPPRVREHKERRERLEQAASEARPRSRSGVRCSTTWTRSRPTRRT